MLRSLEFIRRELRKASLSWRCLAATCVFWLCLFSDGNARAQTLDLLRHEVNDKDAFQPLPQTGPPVPGNGQSGPSNGAPHRNDSGPGPHCDSTDDSWEIWALGYVVTSPVWAPLAITGDDGCSAKPLLRFPYADGAPGYVVEFPDSFPDGKWWSLQTSLEYDATFEDLQRISGELLFSTMVRLDVDLQGNELWEHVDGHADSLFLGRVNFLYRFAQNEYMQFRTGCGVNWLADQHDATGFNFHYGMQVFPVKKVAVTSDLDWGTLGNAPVFHGRMTVGMQRRELEIYTGYDFQHVGGADFSGPIAGCRLYF